MLDLINPNGVNEKFFGEKEVYENCLKNFINDQKIFDYFDEIVLMHHNHDYYEMIDRIEYLQPKACKLALDRLNYYCENVILDLQHNRFERFEDDFDGFCDAFNDTVSDLQEQLLPKRKRR